MSILSTITTGPEHQAQRITLYGVNGIGKTTLASKAPGPVLIIDTERGSLHMDAKRLTINSHADLVSTIKALACESHPYKTVAVDTIDQVEEFLRQRVCIQHGVKGIESIGYGKGWVFLREAFESFIESLDELIIRGINVFIIGHAQVKKFASPGAQDSYDRYELKLYGPNSAKLREWSDAVLFIDWDTKIVESNGRSVALGGKNRVIYTSHAASRDAKNRVNLPDKIECQPEALLPLFNYTETQQTRLAGALDDLPQDHVLAWLQSRGQLVKGGAISDVSGEYCARLLGHLDEARAAITDFSQQAKNNGEVVAEQIER